MRSKFLGERQVVEALNYITWMAGGNKCLKRAGLVEIPTFDPTFKGGPREEVL